MGHSSAPERAVRPDPSKILGGLKDFQRATVEYVFERMYGSNDPTARFLVADEVGLGKTLVARGLIAKAVDALWDDVRRIDVVYICSNSDIARQNIRRLNLLDEDEFALASRITLLPTQIQDLKHRKLNFISFTPGTSLDTRSAMGIARERALLYWMLRDEWSLGRRAGPKNVFQGGSGRDSFRAQLQRFDRAGIDKTLMRAFHRRLVEHDRKEHRDKRPGLHERFDELCQRFAHSRQDHRIPKQDRADRRELIADLRAVLAASCITALEPDLVILDEFQRFRELLEPDPSDDAGKLANELFTYSDAHRKVRVLLLSATPYKMYSTAAESDDEDHHRDFIRTLRFLFSDDTKTEKVEILLRQYKSAMLAFGDDHLKELQDLKGQIERVLKLVIARTERLAVSENRDGMLNPVIGDGLSLEVGDIRSYVQLERIAEALGQPNLLEYWKSAPYALNFMDDYVQKRQLRGALDEPARAQPLRQPITRASNKALLPWATVERYGAVDPANPRVRELRQGLVDSGAWRALWIPPSLPYYEMRGPFGGSRPLDTKRLIFSNWTLVPKATAALLSYEAEREAFRSRFKRPMNTQQARERRTRPLEFRRRSGSLASLPVLGLMYASPVLARELDPLAISLELEGSGLASLSQIFAVARRRARELLRQVPAGAKRTGGADEAWYWAAPMLIDLAKAPESTRSWFADYDPLSQDAESSTGENPDPAVTDHVGFARQLVDAAGAGEIPLGRRPRDLDRVLALQAIAGPGTTALRALGRVTNTEHLDHPEVRNGASRIANGLRTLLNVPEVVSTIRGIDEREPYWLRVLEYSANGCLQAVLDEYCHVLVEAQGLVDRDPEKISDKLPAAIEQALSLRPARLAVDEIGVNDDQVRLERRNMRARYVTRFGVNERTEGGDETTRADSLRNAFNSPFWPFGLVSTSIGQEGLDFHLYCHAVVHWNIPSNPVDLEQREGRVHRYKGHAVRKNIARRYGIAALSDPTADPWEVLFEKARRDRDQEANDLVPYWIYPIEGGAEIERHVPALPMSRDLETYEQVRRSLAVYRMAFGQARQDDLVDFLLSRMPPEQAQAVAEELRIDLAPEGGSV